MPDNPIDLHIHTTYSDGQFTPEAILTYAAQNGLRTLAFTDHDNTNGVRAGMRLANSLGINLIPGIEFTCRWAHASPVPADRDVDLLGYFIDLGNAEFQAFEQAALNDLHERIRICCEKISARGLRISLGDVLAENRYYGGFMQLLHALQHKGYAADWNSAVAIAESAWKSGRSSPFTLGQVIEQIHLAGGVAVLAHPTTVVLDGQFLQEGDVRRLVNLGLDGIEIYHHRLDEAARAHHLALAQRFNLLVTGGTDLHGWWGSGLETLGSQPVTPAHLNALRARAGL